MRQADGARDADRVFLKEKAHCFSSCASEGRGNDRRPNISAVPTQTSPAPLGAGRDPRLPSRWPRGRAALSIRRVREARPARAARHRASPRRKPATSPRSTASNSPGATTSSFASVRSQLGRRQGRLPSSEPCHDRCEVRRAPYREHPRQPHSQESDERRGQRPIAQRLGSLAAATSWLAASRRRA